jgi:hypothetical protein
MKSTPASFEGEHLVVLPVGLTGSVTLEDGTTYDLGPGHQVVVEVESHEHGKEVALLASKLAVEDDSIPTAADFDEAASRKNLGLDKKKGN